MQDGASSATRVAGNEVDTIVKDTCPDFRGMDSSITRHYFLSNMFVDPYLFEKGPQIPLKKWSCMRRARLQRLKVEVLLAV